MLTGTPVVKHSPAMPALAGKRISRDDTPSATREYSSPRAGSYRNREPRSASSNWVAAARIFSSSGSSRISEAIRLTTSISTASSRWARSTFSNRRAFSSAAAAWDDSASSNC